MSQPPQHRDGVEFLQPGRLRLVEAPAPRPSPQERAAMDQVWEEAVRANPCLFDGPVAACAGLDRDGPHDLVIAWARTTYRLLALRRVPGATALLPSLFVSVLQPSEDRRVLVGRMSPATSFPGRWQLPGGTVEPPPAGDRLDAAALTRHAARELAEETGVQLAPQELRLWLVTRGDHGNVGVLFLAPPRPESLLRERHAAAVSAERALGRDPELDEIALVAGPAELPALGGPLADYLEPVLRRYAGALTGR